MIDEALLDWGMPAAPVLADARGLPQLELLLTGLEARGLTYVVRVDPDLFGRRPIPGSAPPPVLAMRSHSRATLWWPHGGTDRPGRAHFVLLTPGSTGAAGVRSSVRAGTRPDPRRRRVLLAEWPPGTRSPRALWVSNARPWHLPSIAGAARLRQHALHARAALVGDHGLSDFEGRSFPGWHHHVTLASVALAHRVLVAGSAEPEETARRA
jgi:hypothetical protein